MTMDEFHRTPPPLSPAVEALLACERVVAEQPEMVRARVLARARESLRVADLTAVQTRSVRLRRVLYAAAAGVVLTASVAVALHHMLKVPAPSAPLSPPPRLAQPVPVAPAALDPHHALPTAAVSPSGEGTAEASAPDVVAPGRRVTLSGRDGNGAEELRLLDRARRSDARGDYLAVLAVATIHERGFPHGRLAEEREVLRVRALVGLGRTSEAREVAVRFRRQFPRSVLLPKIDEMLSSVR